MPEIKVPSGWQEIDIDLFRDLSDMRPEDFPSLFHYKLEVVAALNNMPCDDPAFEDMDIFELEDVLRRTSWLFTEPPRTKLEELSLDGMSLKLKDLGRLKLGEFIDLEYFFREGYHKNIHLICAILYKQYGSDDWGNEIEEPYKYDIYGRAARMGPLPIGSVYGIIKYYLDFKKKLVESYPTVFEPEDWDQIEDQESLSEQEIAEIKMEIEQERKKAAWSWPRIVYQLCDGDITRADKITDLSLLYVFNILAMRKAIGS